MTAAAPPSPGDERLQPVHRVRRDTFRRRDDVERLADVVKFHWEMVSAGGEVAAVGLEFLVLARDGRIRIDYQFIER